MRKISLSLLLAFFSLIVYAQVGNSLHFDGSDNYVETETMVPYTADFTIAAWIKTSSNGVIFAWGEQTAAPNRFTSFAAYSNGLRLTLGDGNPVYIDGDTNVKTGVWVNVAVTKNGSAIKLYVNGVEDLSTTSTTVTDAPVMSTIGAGLLNGSIQSYFNGEIDELSVWESALDVTGVQSVMNNSLVGDETNLLAYYRFDQGEAGADNSAFALNLIDYAGCYSGILKGFSMTGTTSNWLYTGFDRFPVLSTTLVTGIEQNSANSGGQIFSTGTS